MPLVLLAALIQRADRAAAVAAAAAAAAAAARPLARLDDVASLGKPVLATYGEGFNLLVAAHGEGHGRTFQEVIEDPAFLADFRAGHRFAPTARALARGRATPTRATSRASTRSSATARGS